MASGKTSCVVPVNKVTKSGQTRSSAAAPQQARNQTASTSRRACGASAAPVQSRKSSLLSTAGSTASAPVNNSQRGLKLRPTNAPVLPVLCVYSDQNQLVRKEQFRVPPQVKSRQQQRNNENLLASSSRSSATSSQIPVAQQARAIYLKSTVSSTARADSNANGAKRPKMTVPRSTTAKVLPPVASNIKGNRHTV